MREALFFTCRNCHNEIERKYAYKDKRIKYFTLSCLLFTILILVFTSIKAYILTAIALVCLTISSFFQDFYIGKACILARIDGNYNDKLHPVKINSEKVVSGGIYLLKPNSNELGKTNVCREYVAEITKDATNCYLVRVIKPIDTVFTPREFSIFDDKKCIGTGALLV